MMERGGMNDDGHGDDKPKFDHRDCVVCKHAGCDPDGPYCGHPQSFKLTMFGASFNRMHNEGHCTVQEGQLFEERD